MVALEGSQGGPTRRRQESLTSRESGLSSGAAGQTCGDADRPRRRPCLLPLAHAFLALADDDSLPDQRTLPRVLAAAMAAIVLAVGAPLGFLVVDPSDHPVVALSSKFSLAQDDE